MKSLNLFFGVFFAFSLFAESTQYLFKLISIDPAKEYKTDKLFENEFLEETITPNNSKKKAFSLKKDGEWYKPEHPFYLNVFGKELKIKLTLASNDVTLIDDTINQDKWIFDTPREYVLYFKDGKCKFVIPVAVQKWIESPECSAYVVIKDADKVILELQEDNRLPYTHTKTNEDNALWVLTRGKEKGDVDSLAKLGYWNWSRYDRKRNNGSRTAQTFYNEAESCFSVLEKISSESDWIKAIRSTDKNRQEQGKKIVKERYQID